MIENWTKFGRVKATNQRTITKNGWFSDLEILEIHQQIKGKHQQTPATVTETMNTGKPETPNQILHDNDTMHRKHTNANTDSRGKKLI